MEELTATRPIAMSLWKVLFGLSMAATVVWSFVVPDAPLFQKPELARILFWHLPCPITFTGLLIAGGYFSLRYFYRIGPRLQPEEDPEKKRDWDVRAVAAIEMGVVFAVLTLLTGMVFSLAEWGAFWDWDPRQTSFLIVTLIYAAYFALRTAFSDPERTASHSAAYMLAAVLPLLFLVYLFPNIPAIKDNSLHPTGSILGGQIKGPYAYVLTATVVQVAILSVWLYRQRVKVGLLESERSYG